MSPQRPHTAIVTCMDARLDAFRFFDSFSDVVHVLRTAGGRVTGDVMRGLAASCAMGTERVIVMHHTDCAMAAHTDEQIRALLPPGPQPEIEFLTIGDPLEALTRDVHAVRASTLLPEGTEVRGMVFDLETGEAREVEIAEAVGDLAEMRRDYSRAALDEGWLAASWLEQFTLWFDEARASEEIVEPNAMVVATASAEGRPSARTVLLKALDERGFVFNTNLRSRKGREAAENPWGCAVFPWHPVERQVVAAGRLEPVEEAEADAYFATRPYGARISAHVSRAVGAGGRPGGAGEGARRAGSALPARGRGAPPAALGRPAPRPGDGRALAGPPQPPPRPPALQARGGGVDGRAPGPVSEAKNHLAFAFCRAQSDKRRTRGRYVGH